MEDCKVLSSNPEERKEHAIRDHKFPHDFYDFKSHHERKSDDLKCEDVVMEQSSSETAHLSKSDVKKANYFQFGHKANKFSSKTKNTKDITMKELIDELPK